MNYRGDHVNIVSDLEEKRGLIAISIDGSVVLRVRKKHFMKNPLEIGEEIDIEKYEDQMAGIQFPDAYEAALSALDLSARTAREMERSLTMKGFVAPAVRAVIDRLQENGLIDDKRMAERIAQSNSSKAVGIYAVKRKLRAKGISDEDAVDALETFDEEQQQKAACQMAAKLAKRYRDLPAREARAKLSQALARRGFGWDAVRGAVDAVLSNDDFDEC